MVDIGWIVGFAVFTVVALLLVSPETWVLVSVLRNRTDRGVRLRLRDGPVHETARARRDFSERGGISRGLVFVDGEVWAAESVAGAGKIRAGDALRVTGRRGLTLRVEPQGAPDTACRSAAEQ